MNSREKGAKNEREIINKYLKRYFPNIRRAVELQWQSGGADYMNTEPFTFEVKSGKNADIAKVRKWLDQVEASGKKTDWKAVLAKPDRKEPYVIMPLDDFLEIVNALQAEGVI